jgi:hypothetical protein
LPKTFLHFGQVDALQPHRRRQCGAIRVSSVLLSSASLIVGAAADAWMSLASMCAADAWMSPASI